MRDFAIVSAKTFLKTTSISPIRGFLPLSVVVLGEKFNLTKEVLYNGITAPEFIIASPGRLIVRIPESQIGKATNEVHVISTVSLSGGSADLVTEISRPTKTVEGIDRLVQSWLMVFLSNPGSDIFSPQSGSGGRAIIGRTTDRKHKSVSADLTLAIENTKTELLRIQSRVRNIPLSEKLLSSDLDSLQYNEQTSVLSARVSLKNMVGNRAEVSIR